ncbi:MAG: hypothetical protein GX442_13535 [Candidatus Riflebacteria bacterium]|nr:hypothetical protein [Candidatus Riflebacteria bacterium]
MAGSEPTSSRPFSEIIADVSHRMTGNPDTDVGILKKAMEDHGQHPQAKEILRALGRMLFDVLPPDRRKEFEQLFANDQRHWKTMISEIIARIQEKEFDKALDLCQELTFCNEMYADDQETTYLAFRSPLEFAFYCHKNQPKTNVRWPPFPFNDFHYYHAYTLVELKRFDEALAVIDTGLRRNPYESRLLFERAEIHKRCQDMKRFLEATLACHGACHTPADLSHFLRNLGYYLVEQERWDEAYAAHSLSLQWENTPLAMGELAFIVKKTGRALESFDQDLCRKKLEAMGFPLWPDKDWVLVAWSMGESFFGQKEFRHALSAFQAAYQLARVPEIQAKIEACEKELAALPKES